MTYGSPVIFSRLPLLLALRNFYCHFDVSTLKQLNLLFCGSPVNYKVVTYAPLLNTILDRSICFLMDEMRIKVSSATKNPLDSFLAVSSLETNFERSREVKNRLSLT